MNALIGMNGLGVVSIIIGGAVLSLSVLAAFGAGLGMILNEQIRREKAERDSEDLADVLRRRAYQPKPPPRSISHRMGTKPDEDEAKKPYDDQKQGAFVPGRRMVELDLDKLTPEQIREALDMP